MNTTTIQPGMGTSALASAGATASANAKPLWAAIGVLGVCVLAMGASLIHVNKRPAEPTAIVSAAKPATALQSLASLPDDLATSRADPKAVAPGEEIVQPTPKTVAKKAPQHAVAKAAPHTTAHVAAKPVNQPAAMAANQAPAPVAVAQAPAPKAICASCGTVESVTPVVRDGKGGPAGVIAGGVVGGLLGNQVGKGDGRVLGTVLGAAGGAWAGNTIEKKMKKETVYSVRVRMEDGSTRTIEQATAPAVGSKVTLDGSTLQAS